MWQRLSTPDLSEEADLQSAPSSSEACSDTAGSHQRFGDRHSGAGAAPSAENDAPPRSVASQPAGLPFAREDEARTQNGSGIEQALHDPSRSDLGSLLGRLAAGQARSSEAVEAATTVGAPRLAPDSVREEDPVLKELDKLIARLDADEAAARAARRSAPPKLFR